METHPLILSLEFITLIKNTFLLTNYAEILRSNIRFKDFKPKNISNEFWYEILGADVNNLDHANVMVKIVLEYANFFELDQMSALKLHLAAVVHDWGESITGDISRPRKTKRDEIIEEQKFLKIIKELYSNDLFSMIKKVAEETVFTKDKKAGLAYHFWICENIGYFQTGIKAWKESKKDYDIEILTTLKHMALEVVVGNLKRYTSLAEYNVFFKNILKQNSKVINEIVRESEELFQGFSNNKHLTQTQLKNSIRYWNLFAIN